MGGTCSTRERNEKDKKILSQKLKGRDHTEELGVDWKIIL
jgi:hypothetical protein